MKLYATCLKRIFDIFFSILILLMSSPIFIITIILLLIQNNGKPFFFQKRPGLNGTPFYIIKFKSMNDRKDKHGKLLPDVERMTHIGRWVRKLSIDELPQLINVLKGEMSLVGPRPLLMKYVPLYSKEQLRRHDVKPGITGWAQVNGRNSISWARKFELDIHYVDHLSFNLDMKILWMTIRKVLKREGVNQSAERPMYPFNGNN
jgi:undecaprenyl phosphate N,N'-diacetylbacillosamine 1-phosphate transferase